MVSDGRPPNLRSTTWYTIPLDSNSYWNRSKPPRTWCANTRLKTNVWKVIFSSTNVKKVDVEIDTQIDHMEHELSKNTHYTCCVFAALEEMSNCLNTLGVITSIQIYMDWKCKEPWRQVDGSLFVSESLQIIYLIVFRAKGHRKLKLKVN